ncbi:heat shock protein 9/12 [Filobasidium floriforme]|uniref:heat shock protein 9/12 n=1 Tax=Filobasidium floriforme TaxID=5210 RepID=UPI001E8D2FCF|nr:heat shock protein 9/12 [Filobasidium floriforme]KAH8089321.1 heat shock protein 9/12 [Filobasidium floriforme]
MSDMGRQSLGDKASAAVKPDSEKSYVEQATDYVKGTMDSVASTLQPQQEKSTTQKIGDAVSGDNTNRNVA